MCVRYLQDSQSAYSYASSTAGLYFKSTRRTRNPTSITVALRPFGFAGKITHFCHFGYYFYLHDPNLLWPLLRHRASAKWRTAPLTVLTTGTIDYISAQARRQSQKMLRLISATPPPYARKVRIALAEKSIPFELLTEVPWDSTTQTPRYNPLEKLPVLILDDGKSVYESHYISGVHRSKVYWCPAAAAEGRY